MKKIISIATIVITMIAMSVPSFADTPDLSDGQETYTTVESETTYLDDGSYYVTTIDESVPGDMLQAASSTSTKTGSKKTTYYNSSGGALWYVKVTGTFTYNGTASSCTSSTVSAASQVSAWVISSKSATWSGNQATGKATAKRYNGLTVAQTVSKTVILTCSKTGALS
jgi:hypothetical protein